MLFERRRLAIYLQDHLAGATGGLELARRARDANRGSELGSFLAELAAEIEHDRESLEAVMRSCDVEPDHLKVTGAWAGEKLGRLKLNGELTSYSPLSRLIEVEGLYLGVTGKLSLWLNLQRAMGEHLASFDLDELIGRARSQLERLEKHRLTLAAPALAES